MDSGIEQAIESRSPQGLLDGLKGLGSTGGVVARPVHPGLDLLEVAKDDIDLFLCHVSPSLRKPRHPPDRVAARVPIGVRAGYLLAGNVVHPCDVHLNVAVPTLL